MPPLDFDYYTPASVVEAVSLLDKLGDGAKVIAGGQSLIPILNLRLASPLALIDLQRIPDLAYIKEDVGWLVIGAMTRHREILNSVLLRQKCPLLSVAAGLIGHSQIRNRGTLGGSLAHADPAAEFPLALVALEGRIQLTGPGGVREVTAGDFFVTILTTSAGPAEVLTEVRVPLLAQSSGWSFREMTRRHGDFAIVAVAAVVSLDEADRIKEARIALGGVGPKPIRAQEAEEILRGSSPDDGLLASAAEIAARATDPPTDVNASAEYRREMTRLYVRDALREALSRAVKPE